MKMIARIAVLSVLALTASASALAAPPAVPVGTLTIPTPFGSSSVLAWSWGASNSGSAQISGGGGAGKANIQDLSITRFADGQSPLFFNAVTSGQHVPTVVLVDGSTTITLTDVLITSYSLGDNSDARNANTTRTENVTFNFARVAYTVNGLTACFDIVHSLPC